MKNFILFSRKNYEEINNGGIKVIKRKLNNLSPFLKRKYKNILIKLDFILFSKLHLDFFIFRQNLDKKKYILFLHASTADIFAISSLVDVFCEKHGQIELILSSSHFEIVKRYCHSPKIRFVVISDKKCSILRSYIEYVGNYQDNMLKPGIIKPLHIVLYKNLLDLTLNKILHYREALCWVMKIDKDTKFKYPVYSLEDHKEVNCILNSIDSDFKKIIIINPITYTHHGLPIEIWEDFAVVLKNKGYKVVFNLKKNSNDIIDYEFQSKFPSIYLPAHLIPLIAENIAFFCARLGGGFDLAHSFSPTSKAILLLLSDKLEFGSKRVKDYPIDFVNELFLNFCNKEVYKILFLSELNVNADLIEQINSINNV